MRLGRPRANIDPNVLITMLCEGKSSYEICAVFRVNQRTIVDRVAQLKAAGRIKPVGLRMMYERVD